MQVSVNEVQRKPKITADLLVSHSDGSLGIVTKVTRKWVHVTWMINQRKGLGNYHCTDPVKRTDLTICPVGTKLSVKQKA